MSKSSFSMRHVLILVGLSFVFAGCGGGLKSASNSSGGENPPVGEVDNNSFYVRVYDEDKFPFYMQKGSTFGSNCEISVGAASQTVNCYVDIMEHDLYFNGISFQYNYPQNLCDYAVQRPYFYYNQEWGYGPSSVRLRCIRDAAGNAIGQECQVDGVTDNVTCSFTSGRGDACKHSFTCSYDLSAISGMSNCCFGSGVIRNEDEDDSTGGVTSTDTVVDWGGNWGSCLGGAGRTSWTKYSTNGYVADLVSAVSETGLNAKYTVESIITKPNAGSTIPIANYYTTSPAIHLHDAFDPANTRTSNLPYMIDPIDDRSQNKFAYVKGGVEYPIIASDSYLWLCTDRALEVKHMIKVYVREWNLLQEFTKWGTTLGTSGDPDNVGVEGVDCDYYTGSDSHYVQCDDYYDLDDFIRYSIPDNCGVTTYVTTPGMEALRACYFPNERY